MCFNNWQAYLKILIEFIVCCLIVALLIYLFKTKDLNIALIIGLFVIIIFGILDCFLIRGTCFKISENLENEKEEPKKEKTLDDLKDEDKKIRGIYGRGDKEDSGNRQPERIYRRCGGLRDESVPEAGL